MKANYIIIIGGELADCIPAARLSENSKYHVALIEAGENDIKPLIHIPAGYIKTVVNPAMSWMFRNEAADGVNKRRIDMPQIKVLGGRSAINAMLCIRRRAARLNKQEAQYA